jgi:hypothetical protein
VAVAAAKPLLPAPPARPFLMFISLVPDQTFKRVVLAPLDAPDQARYLTPLQCDRVYYAGSRGLCLTAATDRAGTPSYVARVFDEHFAELHTMTLTGAPSRTRLSPDGRRAAFTVFDEGHSYADGVFSTRTTIVDAIGGTAIGELETTLRRQRLWGRAEITGQRVDLRSGSCSDPAMRTVIDGKTALLHAAGLTKLRCLEQSGAVVFERDF